MLSGSAAKRLFLTSIVVLALAFLPEPAFAGTGAFKSGKFNYCVSVRFNATEAQLQRIRQAFSRANEYLADATDGQHQFGTISIVNNSGAGDQAEFWINPTDPSDSRANASGGGYGFRHRHVNLYFPSNFGPNNNHSALTIVHEFAHLAYDLGDEYRTSSLGPELPAECAPLSAESPTLNYCLMDDFTRGGNRITLGNYTVNEFCVAANHDPVDRDTSQHREHGESCWETMSKLLRAWRLNPLAGFPQDAGPATQPVTFLTSCAAQTQRTMLLVDRSGSMLDTFERNEGSRLSLAQRGAARFFDAVNSSDTPGIFVGLASFSTTARVDFPLTEINNPTARSNAKAAINTLAAAGATNIGEGLLAAMEQLNAEGGCSGCEKTIILISDGDHNVGVPPDVVVKELQNSGIKVVSVALGRSITLTGEASLKNLVAQTGGAYFRAPAQHQIISFMGYFANEFGGYVPGVQIPDIFSSGGRKEYPLFIEANAANASIGITQANQGDSFTLSLQKPSGALVTGSEGTNIELTADATAKVFNVTAPEAGTWKIIVTAGTITTGKVDVFADVKHEGVGLFAWVDNEGPTLSTDAVRIHANPTYNGRSVAGSSVTGEVARPDGSRQPLTLFDNGLETHGDSFAGDGIYSALFNSYSTDGTYTFNITSKNTSGHLYGGEPLPADDGTVTTGQGPAAPAFNRFATASAIVIGLAEGDLVWFDDAVPQGATTQGGWYWVDSNPAPVLGGAAHQSKITALGTVDEHSFVGATSKLPVGAGDRLFAYVFLDPNHSPEEIMLQWHAADGWEHRAYWGKNYIQLGTDGTNSRRRMGPLPAAGRWVRLEVPASLVGLEGKVLDGMAFTTNGNRATWDRAGRTRGAAVPETPGDFVWFDDGVPAGSVLEVEHDIWEWVGASPSPFSGSAAHRSVLAGGTGAGKLRSHGFSRAQTPMKVEPGDVLYTYVYVDPSFRPDEIMLQWNDGDGWEHRAYWGNNFVDLGVQGTESRRFMGGIPPSAQWVRLEVPASYVGLEGKSVYGMHFGYYRQNDRARVSWDVTGKTTQLTTTPAPLQSIVPLYRFHADSYGYSYSTEDIGRADQRLQRVQCYVHPGQAAGAIPFYRFRNHTNQRYFYGVTKTAPDNEWKLDGVEFYIYPDQSPPPGTVALHQFFYIKDKKAGYFYTTTHSEGVSLGFTYQGVAGYVHNANPLVPAAPSDVRPSSKGGNPIHWTDNSSNESGFKIERLESDGSWAEIGFASANSTSFFSTQLSCESIARVRAYNAAGHSAYSVQAGQGHFDGGKCWVAMPATQPAAPPTVNITGPAEGAVFKAGATVKVNADAFDANGSGTIARVEFFEGGNKLGESLEAPYFVTSSNVPAGTYTLTATATDTTGLASTSSPVIVTVQPVNPGEVIISEFRFRGSNSYLDEFVELYNNTDLPVTVGTADGSGGWSLVSSDGSVRFTIPNGTTIPARGNFLGVNTAYGLDSYAPGNAVWAADIADGAGVALFKTSNPTNFTLANRLDAVGFAAVTNTLFREGAGLQPAGGVNTNAEHSFFRRLNSGLPKETNDNAADFMFVSTDGIISGGIQSVLGAPGPEGLSSPVAYQSGLDGALLDPAVSSTQAPNRTRDTTSDPANNSTFGTLSLRRTFTNNTGRPVTRLRFRIVDTMTYPPPATGVADLRLRNSLPVQVTRTDGSLVTVQGTTLETPPAQPKGGGFNATASVGSITLAEPLQPGAVVHVQFLLGVQQTGSYRFFLNVEAWQ